MVITPGKFPVLPEANSADRVNPRPYRPLGVPKILLLSRLVDFFAFLWLCCSLFSLDCAFSVFSLLFALLGLWFEVSRPMASTLSPFFQPPAVLHTPPTLWPGGGARWLNHFPAGRPPAWIGLMDSGIDSLADPRSIG